MNMDTLGCMQRFEGEKPRLPRCRQRQRATRQRPHAVRARAGEDLGSSRRGGGFAPRREGGRPAPAGHHHDVHSPHFVERHAGEESARAEALEARVALEQRGRRRRRRQRGALELHEAHLCVQLGELLLDRAEEAHLVAVGVRPRARARARARARVEVTARARVGVRAEGTHRLRLRQQRGELGLERRRWTLAARCRRLLHHTHTLHFSSRLHVPRVPRALRVLRRVARHLCGDAV